MKDDGEQANAYHMSEGLPNGVKMHARMRACYIACQFAHLSESAFTDDFDGLEVLESQPSPSKTEEAALRPTEGHELSHLCLVRHCRVLHELTFELVPSVGRAAWDGTEIVQGPGREPRRRVRR